MTTDPRFPGADELPEILGRAEHAYRQCPTDPSTVTSQDWAIYLWDVVQAERKRYLDLLLAADVAMEGYQTHTASLEEALTLEGTKLSIAETKLDVFRGAVREHEHRVADLKMILNFIIEEI